MPPKIRIADAANTLIPAYLALQQKGLAVCRLEPEKDSGQEMWSATDKGREFRAEDPLRLLGLVSLHEVRGDDWQATDEQIQDFIDNSY